MTVVSVHLYYPHSVNNQPVLLPETLFLSRCAVRPASAIASSQTPECRQNSHMIITEQSLVFLRRYDQSSVLLLSDSVCEKDAGLSRLMG